MFNFIRCCSKQLAQPLALAAVHCMGEVRLATETRESEHKYKNNEKTEVRIPYYLSFTLEITFTWMHRAKQKKSIGFYDLFIFKRIYHFLIVLRWNSKISL